MKVLPVNYFTNRNQFVNVKNNIRYTTLPMACDSVSFTATKQKALKNIVILLGAPNSGKGTCAGKISKKFGIPQISTGDILRNEVKNYTELGLEAKQYMESGKLVPDDLIMKIFNKRISEPDCAKGFILDGFPRTVNQAKELNKTLGSYTESKLNIINLDVERSILYERSASRYMCPDCSRIYSIREGYNPETSKCECGAKLIKRSDDTPEVLTKRLESYDKQTLPLLDFYKDSVFNVKVKDNHTTPDEVFAVVSKYIDK